MTTPEFSKLYSRIVDSTLWNEPIHVRCLFVSMLAIADWEGIVPIHVPRLLAKRVSMDVEDVEDALAKLMQPDPDSRSKEHDGRRVIELPDNQGYQLVTAAKYRETRSPAQEKARLRKRRQRERQRDASQNVTRPVTRHDVTADRDRDRDKDKKREADKAEIEKLWATQDRLRKAADPNCRSLKLTAARARAVRARLKEHGLAACIHVLHVYAAEASVSGSVEWMNGVTNWRPDNFDRALSKDHAKIRARRQAQDADPLASMERF